ncbi:putative membrane protein [Inhella inkyongensis]|uniref:Putative membrane protein n=1 Tax=Inhella inkyongensis TaxID=392593 RepID=A0A840S971_9BURK|nr:hypothetical protein [Inhella inkyongensis]MBB5204959.1 putative membrane protein [Inhella inkyongensis]
MGLSILHWLAGGLALGAGAWAMAAAKGSAAHKRAGMGFVIAMLIMGSSGALMAAMKPVRISVVAGLLVVYLVSTALLTVRREVAQARGLYAGLSGLGLVVAGLGLGWALQAGPGGQLDRFPAPIYAAFGTLALLGVAMDLKALHANALTRSQRLVRHLWRMETAMYLATSAFFLGQAKLFPEALRHTVLLALPVLAVLAHLAYWMWRSLRRPRRTAVA